MGIFIIAAVEGVIICGAVIGFGIKKLKEISDERKGELALEAYRKGREERLTDFYQQEIIDLVANM